MTFGSLRVGRYQPRVRHAQELIIDYVAACDALHEHLNFDDFVSGWLAAQELSVLSPAPVGVALAKSFS